MKSWLEPQVLACGGLAACSAALLMLFFFDPASSALFPSCPFHYFTGLHCPGCGTLRAIHRLLHFRFADAFAMNPLTIICLPFLGYGLLSAFSDALLAKPWPRISSRPSWSWALLVLVVSFGVARNLPFAPFKWLAPGGLLGLFAA